MKAPSELGISPTPWHNEDDYIVADDGTPIARMVTGGKFDADTRMVKAAPNMYELCYQFVEAMTMTFDWDGKYEKEGKKWCINKFMSRLQRINRDMTLTLAKAAGKENDNEEVG